MVTSRLEYNSNFVYNSFWEDSFRRALYGFIIIYIIQVFACSYWCNLFFTPDTDSAMGHGVWGVISDHLISAAFLLLLPAFVALGLSGWNLRLAGLLVALSQVGAILVYTISTNAWSGYLFAALGLVLISWFQDLLIFCISVFILVFAKIFHNYLRGTSSYDFLFLISGMGFLVGVGILNNRRALRSLADQCAQSIEHKEKALQQLEIRSRVFSHLNHEIRNPLSSIIGFLEVLQDTNLDIWQTQYVRTAHRCSNTLMQIIGNALDFSKLESGALKVEPHIFKIRELHHEVMDMFILACSSKGVALELKVDGCIPDIVKLDALLLKQILINIVGNAVKFTNRGKIEVEVKKDDSSSVYTWIVSDTGCGIKEESIENLFQSFYQDRTSMPSAQVGTGLGLSISKSFIEAMGGQISVCSKLGEGTVFTFSLPIHEC